MLIEYDDITSWAPSLSKALAASVPEDIRNLVSEKRFNYLEDSLKFLFKSLNRDQIIDETLKWISNNHVAAYHGSRLQQSDIESIREIGLRPLRAIQRKARIQRALQNHPNWPSVESRLDLEIEKHGAGQAAGNREGQVHLTLSRYGLTQGFNHYILRGSEFDQHVANALLGEEGEELLEKDGTSVIIKVSLPGNMAIDGAHRHFNVEMKCQMRETPNLVREFLESWSYWLSEPTYQTKDRHLDCGIWFKNTVPPQLIVAIEPWIARRVGFMPTI